MHSFWIVRFEFKHDMIPGHPDHFEVTPIRTGTFIGHCTELCGVYHSRMLFRVRIVARRSSDLDQPRSSVAAEVSGGCVARDHRRATPGAGLQRFGRKGSILAS